MSSARRQQAYRARGVAPAPDASDDEELDDLMADLVQPKSKAKAKGKRKPKPKSRGQKRQQAAQVRVRVVFALSDGLGPAGGG